jgi:hypothetical protein
MWLIVVAVIAVVAVVAGSVVAFQLARAPPNMTITNYQLTDQTNCPYSAGGDILVTYDLVNTGGPGFARIVYAIDGVQDHTNDYFVSGGKTSAIQDTVSVSDCNSHDISAEITSQWVS